MKDETSDEDMDQFTERLLRSGFTAAALEVRRKFVRVPAQESDPLVLLFKWIFGVPLAILCIAAWWYVFFR